MREARSLFVALALVCSSAVVLLTAPAAVAGPTVPGGGTKGGSDGPEINAGVKTRAVIHSSGGNSGNGEHVTPVDTNWTPPPCWYEPVATPKQLKKAVDDIEPGGKLVPVTKSLLWGEDLMREYYRDGKDGNPKNYNLDKQGEGMWWRSVLNPNRPEELNSMDCEENMLWVDEGEKAPVPEAVDAKTLAGYAYDSIKVPKTKVQMNPKPDAGKVNLASWVWQKPGTFEKVDVTAELPGTGLWATTTATPKSLHLDPGTDDAIVHPAGGECPINKDGSIGKQYQRGDGDKTPPCGITYTRSSDDSGPYQMTASITWEIHWNGSQDTGGDLPDGVFETNHAVTVKEVQTVTR